MQDVTASWRRVAGVDADMLARPLAEVMQRAGLRVLGIAGAPGAGKSTVAHGVAARLTQAGHDPLVISLDDYYLSKAARTKLGIDLRGPPGTHDVRALVDVLDAIAAARAPIVVQRFSAALDEQIEPTMLDRVPTQVLVEGWVLGHRADGYEQILDRLDLLVFLDLDEDTAKRRRFEREAELRKRGGGFSEQDMQRFWDERIAPGLPLWVNDARTSADLLIECRPDGGVRRVSTSSPLVEVALG